MPVLEREEAIEPLDLCQLAANAALKKKAEDALILDVRGLVTYCDFFILLSGTNRRQVSAIAEAVLEDVQKGASVRPLGVEGLPACRWVLVDFGAVVVHVFDEDLRSFYDLEALWADAPRVPVQEVAPPVHAQPAP